MDLERFPNDQEVKAKDLNEKKESLLKKMPPEIRQRVWDKRFANEDPEEVLADLEKAVAEREDLKKEPFYNYIEEEAFPKNEVLRKRSEEEILSIVKEASENTLKIIGKGKTANVHVSKTNSDYCYKIITDPGEYKTGNDVKREVLIQEAFIKNNTSRVKVPEPYYYKMNRKVHLYVMETLKGLSLQDVLERGAKIPENFNFEDFFAELQKFIDEQNSKGNHHRDFHEGNIMIMEETGLPGVIDFGHSTKNQKTEDAYQKNSHMGTTVYIKDLDELIRVKNRLRSFITI